MRFKLSQRFRFQLALAVLLSAAILPAASTAACVHHPPDTSQLSPQGLHDFKASEAMKKVNDVTTAAVAANRAGQLSDAATQQILAINKQVLDYLNGTGTTTREKAIDIAKNARDALPANVKALVTAWVDKTIKALEATS